MAKKHNFRNLKVWQLGIELVTQTYLLTRNFPDYEKFGLTSQLRRSAYSIPINIAEGSGRGTEKDFVRFLGFSLGSAYEFETHVIVCHNLKFLTKEDANELIDSVQSLQRMLNTFIIKLGG